MFQKCQIVQSIDLLACSIVYSASSAKTLEAINNLETIKLIRKVVILGYFNDEFFTVPGF